MGNQCTGTRVKGMISWIDFKGETIGKDDTQFPNEEDIQRKINKYVEEFHEETRKTRRNKSKGGSVIRSQHQRGPSKSDLNTSKNIEVIQGNNLNQQFHYFIFDLW